MDNNVCRENLFELDDDWYADCLTCGLDGDQKSLIASFGGDMYFELYCEDCRRMPLSLDDVPGDDPRWDVCSSRIGWV